ncbi:MAG: phosphatidylglycerophosphatase A [Desulfonauticus sp.]|nr:phosphatidylglycerophosphatase A [Desulfonauticus sp.]
MAKKIKRFYRYLASMGPVGFIPFAPGTFGSLLTVIFIYFFPGLSFGFKFGLALILFFLGWFICSEVEREWKVHDPSWIIIDEVGGQLVTFLWVHPYSWMILVVGFVLFRFFDILKPWPINRLEKIAGGLGIMADDYMAGLLGGGVLYCLIKYVVI